MERSKRQDAVAKMQKKPLITKTPQWNSKDDSIPRGRRKNEGTKEEGVI
jgi:hypothetical protein